MSKQATGYIQRIGEKIRGNILGIGLAAGMTLSAAASASECKGFADDPLKAMSYGSFTAPSGERLRVDEALESAFTGSWRGDDWQLKPGFSHEPGWVVTGRSVQPSERFPWGEETILAMGIGCEDKECYAVHRVDYNEEFPPARDPPWRRMWPFTTLVEKNDCRPNPDLGLFELTAERVDSHTRYAWKPNNLFFLEVDGGVYLDPNDANGDFDRNPHRLNTINNFRPVDDPDSRRFIPLKDPRRGYERKQMTVPNAHDVNMPDCSTAPVPAGDPERHQWYQHLLFSTARCEESGDHSVLRIGPACDGQDLECLAQWGGNPYVYSLECDDREPLRLPDGRTIHGAGMSRPDIAAHVIFPEEGGPASMRIDPSWTRYTSEGNGYAKISLGGIEMRQGEPDRFLWDRDAEMAVDNTGVRGNPQPGYPDRTAVDTAYLEAIATGEPYAGRNVVSRFLVSWSDANHGLPGKAPGK